MPSASLPSSSGLCWPQTVFAEELERAHQLAELMPPGWLHDPERERSSEDAGSAAMYNTWRGKKDSRVVWFWTKAYPKFSFLYSTRTLPLVRLKEKVESGGDAEPWLKPLFFYVKCSLVCMLQDIRVHNLNESERSDVHSRFRWGSQHCSVNVKLWDVCILNYFFNWLSDPVNEWCVSALKGNFRQCLTVGSADPCVLVSYSLQAFPESPVDGLFLIVTANTDGISRSACG